MSTGNSWQAVSEVINIEDDEDEDVEVVFTNLDKSHVQRNLMCQKISQELELLQAICKQTVPSEFNLFKEQARKLGFRYGDDVIRSAWQRIMKKCMMKLTSFPNDTAPVCLVRPLRPSVGVCPIRETSPASSPHSAVTRPASSPPAASTVVPIALLLNQSVSIENAPRQVMYEKNPELNDSIGRNMYPNNDQTTNTNKIAHKQIVLEQESRYRQTEVESVRKKIIYIDEESSEKRSSETEVFSSDLGERDLTKSRSEESVQHSLVSVFSESYSSVSRQNVLQVVSLGSPENVSQPHKEIDSVSDNRCSKTAYNSASNKNILKDKKCSNRKKSRVHGLSFNLDESSLSNSESEESDIVSSSFESYFHGGVSEQNRSGDMSRVTRQSSRKCKSSNKETFAIDSPKTVDQTIAKAHVGFKAKIVRSKRSSPNSRKSAGKKIKEMSEAELKIFKAEQKRIKFEQKREFELQQLQKVHDRLVEVLIPKYHNKDLHEKG